MTEPSVWVDGRLLPASQASVSVYDRAFRSGLGVFETLRVHAGRPFRLAAHADRATAGAAELGIEVAASALADAVLDTLEANRSRRPGGDAVIRLTVSAGSLDPAEAFPGAASTSARIVVTEHPVGRRPDTVTAASVPMVRSPGHLKTTSYVTSLLAESQARRRRADTALLVDTDGTVTEAATANLFAVVAGRLRTPPADGRLLPGITRGITMDLARDAGIEVEETPLSLAGLRVASEAMLTSAVRGIIPLTRFDDVVVGDGSPGPVTRALREAYDLLVARESAGITAG